MTPPPTTRCVLLFTRSPRREARAKRLPGAEGLFTALLDRAVAAAAGIPGVDLIVVGDPGSARLPADTRVLPQRGSSFGQRLENAFADVRSLGYREIVAIGADSPGLGGDQLAAAFAALKTRDVVLGPAPDGGAFLIGLRIETGSLLRGIAWRTGRVLSQLVGRRPDAAVLSAPIADVDGRADLRSLLADPGLDPDLAALIRTLILSRPSDPLPREGGGFPSSIPAPFSGRAPPPCLCPTF